MPVTIIPLHPCIPGALLRGPELSREQVCTTGHLPGEAGKPAWRLNRLSLFWIPVASFSVLSLLLGTLATIPQQPAAKPLG